MQGGTQAEDCQDCKDCDPKTCKCWCHGSYEPEYDPDDEDNEDPDLLEGLF